MTDNVAGPILLWDYLENWPFDNILGANPGERLTREEIRFRVIRKAFDDPKFERELAENTRLVCAIAYEEGLGIDRYKFVDAVLTYNMVYETPIRLYMELPSCHRGCTLSKAPESPEPRTSCHVCEKAFPRRGDAPLAFGRLAPEPLSRRKIEGLIQKRAAWDSEFSRAFFRRPFRTYVAYATELCDGRRPPYLEGIQEVELLRECSSEMFFIMPTRESFAREIAG